MEPSDSVEGELDTESRSVTLDALAKEPVDPIIEFPREHLKVTDDGLRTGRSAQNEHTSSREEHDAGSSAIHVHVSSGVPADIPVPCRAEDGLTENKLNRMRASQSLPAAGDGIAMCTLRSQEQTECSGVANIGPLSMDQCKESEEETENADVSNTTSEHHHVHTAPISNSGYASYPTQSEDAHLTPEERTRQRRMLRNRESAARSRDKRKYKNMALESSIAKLKATSENLQHLHAELTKLLGTMKAVVKKTKSF